MAIEVDLPSIFNLEPYQDDAKLFYTERGSWWKEHYAPLIAHEVEEAMMTLGLDSPWEEVAANPVKQALANALWSTALACFGPKLSADQLIVLNKARFGDGYVPVDVAQHVFTSNHLSVSCVFKPLGSDAQPVVGPALVHHMPTFASIEGGKPAIGDVSPIQLLSKDGKFLLAMTTPSGHLWQKEVVVMSTAEFSTQMVGSGTELVPLKTIASPCASAFQVTILRPTCQENCLMCTVPRGTGEISLNYKEQVSCALDVLIEHAAINKHAFQQTLSGGTLSFGDGGFATAHAWGMELIAEKVAKFSQKHSWQIPVQLQLEMVLPPDKSTWQSVLATLQKYLVLGWKISLAVNMEVLHDEWEGLFLWGNDKGVSTVADHLEFAQALAYSTKRQVQMNSLIMYGLKPLSLSYADYLVADLAVLPKLVAAGIKPDYQPVKIENGTLLEAYPPPNPVYLLVQDLALKALVTKHKLPIAPGCVGGCNACDQSHETAMLFKAAKKANIALPELLAPVLDAIGPIYKEAFIKVFDPVGGSL